MGKTGVNVPALPCSSAETKASRSSMGCPWPCRCSAEAVAHCLGRFALYNLAKMKIVPLNKIFSQALFKHPLEFPFVSVACQNAFESSAAESGKVHVSAFH